MKKPGQCRGFRSSIELIQAEADALEERAQAEYACWEKGKP
jgi:hypothetical protein